MNKFQSSVKYVHFKIDSRLNRNKYKFKDRLSSK